MTLRPAALLVFLLLASAAPAVGEELTREAVIQALEQATADQPADFSGRSLEKLDLSGLDLSGARFVGANLSATKLEDSKLVGADLSGANLTLTWIIRADLTNANLSGATLWGLVVASGLETNAAEAPIFTGANFSGARIVTRFNGFDLTGTNFTDAKAGVDMRNQSMGMMRADFSGTRLADADFTRADLGRALFRFAKLKGASFVEASLVGADFSGADLTGADLTDADATDADFGNAILRDAKGLDTAKGLEAAGAQQ